MIQTFFGPSTRRPDRFIRLGARAFVCAIFSRGVRSRWRRGRLFNPAVRAGGVTTLQGILLAIGAVLVIGIAQTLFVVFL